MDLATLSNVNVDDLMKFSAKKAAEISISLINKNRMAGEEILKYWSTKLFEFYGLVECTNDIVTSILDSIQKYLITILNDQQRDENIQNKSILEYLTQWRNIYTWISTKTEDFNLYSLSIFIENGLKTLELILSYSTTKKSNRNGEIYKECIQIQELMSLIISENFSMFHCQVESCMEIIIKLTKLHCNIVRFILWLDIKSAANLLKLIVRLYLDNAEFYKNNFEIDFKWVKTPVILLCEEINKSVKFIYGNNNDSWDKMERILKINSFYIKCLEKLATEFDHNYFHGCFQLLETIYLVLNMPKIFKGTKKEEDIQQYLIVGFLNLLNLLYKNAKFINKLLEEKNFTTADECANFCLILTEILKILCVQADDEIVYLYLDNKILEKLFKNIPHSRELFSSQNKREEFIGLVASLFLQHHKSIKVMKLFENLLSNGVLQDDFLLANICIDICLVVVRFIHADNRYKYFKFWIKTNENFPKFSDNLQSVYTEYLINSLYELLPNNYKSEFWSSYFSGNIVNDNRTLLTLGINKIFDQTQRTIHKNKLQAELQRNIQITFETSIEKYYRVIEILKLLCETNIDNSFLAESLLQFWPLLSMDINLQKHDLFFRMLFKCCSRNIEIFNNNQIQNILLFMEKYASVIKSSDNVILNLELYDFLTEIIKKKTIFKDKANQIQNLLRNNPENKLIEFLRLENNSPKPSTSKESNCNIDSKKYMENQFFVDFEHMCKISDSRENSPGKSNWQNKKIRLDGGREIVKEAIQAAEKIEYYFKYEKPNSMDIEVMRQIIGIYGCIIDKNT